MPTISSSVTISDAATSPDNKIVVKIPPRSVIQAVSVNGIGDINGGCSAQINFGDINGEYEVMLDQGQVYKNDNFCWTGEHHTSDELPEQITVYFDQYSGADEVFTVAVNFRRKYRDEVVR